MSQSLSTLDLTANRITGDGLKALITALCQPTCKLQRLNVRHNMLQSNIVSCFGDVLAKNKSLIQLFLGFINPDAEAAKMVLAGLRQNSTLLLLDIYG